MEHKLPTSTNDTVACNLDAFPGRDPNFNGVACERLELSRPCPPVVIIEAAWCVTLYMYTGLSHICVQSKDTSGQVTTKASEIWEDDDLSIVAARLYDDSGRDDARRRYQSNNAIILEKYRQHEGSNDVQTPNSLSRLLWQGIDVALCGTDFDYTLVFRCNFMSSSEARNFGATFCHVLATYNAIEAAPKVIRDMTLSQQDLDRIVEWNSNDLVTGVVLLHDEISHMASMQPEAEAIDAWDGRMTYRDLERASNSLANYLRQIGVGPGSWVILCSAKSRWAIISMLAALKTGLRSPQ